MRHIKVASVADLKPVVFRRLIRAAAAVAKRAMVDDLVCIWHRAAHKFAIAAKQSFRIGQTGAAIEAEVDVSRVEGDIDFQFAALRDDRRPLLRSGSLFHGVYHLPFWLDHAPHGEWLGPIDFLTIRELPSLFR